MCFNLMTTRGAAQFTVRYGACQVGAADDQECRRAPVHDKDHDNTTDVSSSLTNGQAPRSVLTTIDRYTPPSGLTNHMQHKEYTHRLLYVTTLRTCDPMVKAKIIMSTEKLIF